MVRLMEFRILETRYDYEEILCNPAYIAANIVTIEGFRYIRIIWCDYCLSRVTLTHIDCPNCHSRVGDDTPFFIGALRGVEIYASKDVMNSNLSYTEYLRLYPPDLPPPPPRGWFTKILDFLQAGI